MKTLTTDQMTTLLKTLTIFIENRDPFTTENIVNELKRDGDQFNGFYDDKGESIADDLYEEIDDAVDSLMLQFYPDFIAEQRRVFIYEPEAKQVEDFDDDWDEYEELDDDDEVDKEGNKIPSNYSVHVEDDSDGRTTYSLKPQFDKVDDPSDPPPMPGAYRNAKGEWTLPEEKEDLVPGEYRDQNGEIDWDRDAAESYRLNDDFANYQDPDWQKYDNNIPHDHDPEYELTVDKQKRINIGKKILVKQVNWKENEKVVVIADKDGKNFYVVSGEDDSWGIGEDEQIVGEYQLKNGALRISLGAVSNIKPGDVLYAKIHWPVMCTDDNLLYIHIYSK